jgi:2-haloacid dehalogenase
VLSRHGKILGDAALPELYGEFEAAAESGAYQSYREVLHSALRAFGARLGFTPASAEIASLPESLPAWPPFPDTVVALPRLKKRYRLALISNIDDDLFAQTQKTSGGGV